MWHGYYLGYNWMLGLSWGGWLFAFFIVALIIVVIQQTGRPRRN
jgi:hypothetical protein